MSQLSYMEKLLDGVEVEWKLLGDICDIKNGYTPSKSKPEFWTNGNIPWFRMEDIRKNGRVLDGSIQHITTIAVKSGRLFPENSIIISTTATIGEHALVTKEFLCNQQLTVLSIKESAKKFLNYKYLFYYSFILGDLCRKNVNPGGFALIGTTKIKSFQIPIPPLNVQAEIVRILDTFTELTAELTAELKARQQQYAYYRDELLTFEEGEVEWKALGEVGELVRGNGLPKKDFTESGVPAIHYGQIYTYYGLSTTETKSFVSLETAKKLKKVNTGDVVITNTSENLEDVGKALVYLGEEQAVTGGHATIFKPSKDILGKYFAYFTQSIIFSNEKRKYSKGTKVIDVSATDMSKINIPIPPIHIQAEIVRILDTFTELTTELAVEITARQQQYEYYRDLLLSFPKPEVVAHD